MRIGEDRRWYSVLLELGDLHLRRARHRRASFCRTGQDANANAMQITGDLVRQWKAKRGYDGLTRYPGWLL